MSPQSGELLSAATIGVSNRIALLRALSRCGRMSRAELARLTGVPRGSVAPIVAGLIADGFLIEGKSAAAGSKGGKPAIPLDFGPRLGVAAAIQLSPDGVYSALVSPWGDLVEPEQTPLDPHASRDHIEAAIIGAAQRLRDTAGSALRGLGLVWPAVWDAATGVVIRCSPIPQLEGSAVAGQLPGLLAAPLFVEDDARGLALGHRWRGQVQGKASFVALQISHGIGAGILIDGELYQLNARFPEVGHLCVAVDGPVCSCGRRGCWEAVAGLEWLRSEVSDAGLGDAAEATPAVLAALEADGNHLAGRILRQFAKNVATGIVNLALAYGVNHFLIHGEITQGGPRLESDVRNQVAIQSTLPGLSDLVVEFAEKDQEMALLGAANRVFSAVIESA